MNVSACATYDRDNGRPIAMAVYVQGGEEAASTAKRLGLRMVSPDWDGEPLFATELNLKEAEQPLEQANRLLGLFEQQDHDVQWITTLAPGLREGWFQSNCYVHRDDLMEALSRAAGS